MFFGPILATIYVNGGEIFYETYELRLVDILDDEVIKQACKSARWTELMLNQYSALALVLVIEFLDYTDNLLPKTHAVALEFDVKTGVWTEKDSNFEDHRVIDSSVKVHYNIRIIGSAIRVTVMEWTNSYRSKDPDFPTKGKMTFNELRRVTNLLEAPSAKDRPEDRSHLDERIYHGYVSPHVIFYPRE